MNMHSDNLHVYTPHDRKSAGKAKRADPITTQVVRYALNAAANRMKRVLIRTAFSSPIYEGHDFTVTIYDRQIRLLAQAPTLPLFMGTMSFCVESAVSAAGGEAALAEGDVILYNVPYGSGSHAPDVAVVMPVFREGVLVGYAAAKAHLGDIGAKNPYPSDSIDVFQEGLKLEGVKFFRRGELVEDVLKIIMSNSRLPDLTKGDLLAVVACCRAGAEELVRVIDRFGMVTFLDCTERMYEHGETVVRDFIARMPDGRYEAFGHLDNDGLSDEPIKFKIALIVERDEVTFDLSEVPDAVRGPLNSPFPGTVSACRIALAMLAGNEAPNEGHFRPLRIISRPGSMLHAVSPQPTFLYGWPLMQLIEAVYQAVSGARDGRAPSGSAGDFCGVAYFGFDEVRREMMIAAATPLPVGMGATAEGDGATLMHLVIAHSRLPSVELLEAKSPFIRLETWEITPDSAGPGKYRGGLGWKVSYRLQRDAIFMTAIERTKVASWGQGGGLSGATNRLILNYPDGRTVPTTKITDIPLPQGTLTEVYCGGGGGYGSPLERDPKAVLNDLRLGYITEQKAREHYPHAFA